MIKKWMMTGDTHGDMRRFSNLYDEPNPETVGMIILGDAGVNYFLDKRDKRTKEILKNYLFRFYLVRGNHEARPQDVPDMIEIYDQEVKNFVYMEPEYPNIRYFKDGEIYYLNGVSALVIGGAYSVDKWYRKANGWGWFENEQLSSEEWKSIHEKCNGTKVDLVLSHTCPIGWEPTDLFLDFIDQEEVDKTTENELEVLKNSIDWKIWLFGHYHADRAERPGVEMMYRNIDSLDNIWDRWYYDDSESEWWIHRSPNYDKKDV